MQYKKQLLLIHRPRPYASEFDFVLRVSLYFVETIRRSLSIPLQISKFQRQRVVEFQKALILYAEAKIKTARDISALIAKDISTLKQMEFSSSASE